MARIPIQNETTYTLTDDITQQIIRDAQEHFGEEVRAIRVQSGLERHALNARTWEVRYAFEDVEEDEEDIEPIETSLESLDERQDDEEDDVFTLDAPVEDMDEDDEDNFLEDEEENVFEDDEV